MYELCDLNLGTKAMKIIHIMDIKQLKNITNLRNNGQCYKKNSIL